MVGRKGRRTAEGGVEDDVVVSEVVVDRAPGPAYEGGRRSPPAGRVRGSRERVGGDGAAGEVEDVDGVARPFQGVDPAAVTVEAVAEGRRAAVLDPAAPAAVLVHQGAAGTGVQCHGVLRLVVDAFDDVDFAVVGPLVMMLSVSVYPVQILPSGVVAWDVGNKGGEWGCSSPRDLYSRKRARCHRQHWACVAGRGLRVHVYTGFGS